MSMTKDEMLEQVRVNLLRMMARNHSLTVYAIADKTGYSRTSITKFVNGDRVTMPIAHRIVVMIPEAGDGIVCPHCGHLMIN